MVKKRVVLLKQIFSPFHFLIINFSGKFSSLTFYPLNSWQKSSFLVKKKGKISK